MRRRLTAAIALAIACAAPPVRAAPDADTLLKRAFDNYRSASSHAAVQMVIHRPDWERQLAMTTWTRGENDALVRFTAPEKDAGNATLKLDHDTWVYNPKLNQVIELPPSMMAQSWMGSDFSYNDLAKSEDILTDYTHRIVATGSAGGHATTTIDALPKPGAPVVWGKIRITLRDDNVVAEEIFFDQDMKPARIMQTDRIGTMGGRSYPVIMTMHPQDEPGQWTRVQTLQAEFDTPMPDYLFTLSNLQNPRE